MKHRRSIPPAAWSPPRSGSCLATFVLCLLAPSSAGRRSAADETGRRLPRHPLRLPRRQGLHPGRRSGPRPRWSSWSSTRSIPTTSRSTARGTRATRAIRRRWATPPPASSAIRCGSGATRRAGAAWPCSCTTRASGTAMPWPPIPIGPRVDADGKPDDKATSVFGPYVDKLMIPQLRELAGDYGVDGVWVDGDCWAHDARLRRGGRPRVLRADRRRSRAAQGRRTATGTSGWISNREGFRRYLRHYVDELKASHPDFQVISNWAFSDHMPEPVTAGVAALSGDFSPDDSVNSARFAGRCLENQGRPWDLMSWSFSRKTRQAEAGRPVDAGGGRRAGPGRRLPGLLQAGPRRLGPRPGRDGRHGRGRPVLPRSARPSATAPSPCRRSPCSTRRPATTAVAPRSSIRRAATASPSSARP